MQTFKIGERVLFNHCADQIPAIIHAISQDGRKVQIEVIGDKKNPRWIGKHWYPVSNIELTVKG